MGPSRRHGADLGSAMIGRARGPDQAGATASSPAEAVMYPGRGAAYPSAWVTTACASSMTRARCSSPRKLSAYTL